MDVKEIPCNLVDGEYVVDWDDIEYIFPDVTYVRNGNVTITWKKDSNRIR